MGGLNPDYDPNENYAEDCGDCNMPLDDDSHHCGHCGLCGDTDDCTHEHY